MRYEYIAPDNTRTQVEVGDENGDIRTFHTSVVSDPVKLRLIKQKDGSYRTESINALGTLGFGVSTNDRQDGASNKNGAYTITAHYNGQETYHILYEKFSFAETRYLNRHIDYGYYRENKSRIQKLFRQSNNPLSLIKRDPDNGLVVVEKDFSSVYSIKIKDYKGNLTQITIPIKGKANTDPIPSAVKESTDYIMANRGNSITKGKYSVYIPAESLYEDAALNIESIGDTLKFHKDRIPSHKNMTISVDVSNYKKEDLPYLYIGRLNYGRYPSYTTTYRSKTKLSAKTKTFGNFVIAMDTVPPIIEPLNFADGKWISKNETLELKVEDIITGVSSYRATVNGNFILTEYDYKKDVLVYDFDDDIVSETENKLKVIVTDNVGNSATFEATFFRKEL